MWNSPSGATARPAVERSQPLDAVAPVDSDPPADVPERPTLAERVEPATALPANADSPHGTLAR